MNGTRSGPLSERKIERLLASPEPCEPPPGLLDALKAEIPPLDTLSASTLSRTRPPRGGWVVPGPWLAAASVVFVLIGGTLAWRLWQREPSLARTASVTATAPESARSDSAEAPPPAERLAGASGSAGGTVAAPPAVAAPEAAQPLAELAPPLAQTGEPLAKVEFPQPVEVPPGALVPAKPQIGARAGTAASDDLAASRAERGLPTGQFGVVGGVAGGVVTSEELARIPTAREPEAPAAPPPPPPAPKPMAARPAADAVWLDAEAGRDKRPAPSEPGEAKEKQETKSAAPQAAPGQARPSGPVLAAVPWRSGAGRFVIALAPAGRGRSLQLGEEPSRDRREQDERNKDRLDRIRDEGQSAGAELAEPQAALRQAAGVALRFEPATVLRVRPASGGWRPVGGWEMLGGAAPLFSFEIELRPGTRGDAVLAYLRMPDRTVPLRLSDLDLGWRGAPWELRAAVLRGELEAALRGEREGQSTRQRTQLLNEARSLAEPHAGETRADEILGLVQRLEDAGRQRP